MTVKKECCSTVALSYENDDATVSSFMKWANSISEEKIDEPSQSLKRGVITSQFNES